MPSKPIKEIKPPCAPIEEYIMAEYQMCFCWHPFNRPAPDLPSFLFFPQPDELEGVHTHHFKLKPFKKAKSCDICKQAITKEGLICKGECRRSSIPLLGVQLSVWAGGRLKWLTCGWESEMFSWFLFEMADRAGACPSMHWGTKKW